jgi:glutamine synthetase
MLRAAFGDAVIDSYIKLRVDDWNSYCRHLTQWELERTLDC